MSDNNIPKDQSLTFIGTLPMRFDFENNSLLNRLTRDVMEIASSDLELLSTIRHRIGKHELCEPDYKQVLWWAKQLEMVPENVLDILENTWLFEKKEYFSMIDGLYARYLYEESREASESYWEDANRFINDGSFISLFWDFDLLPIKEFYWEQNLNIKKIVFIGNKNCKNKNIKIYAPNLNLKLDYLEVLDCGQIYLNILDLKNVPRLQNLNCSFSSLYVSTSIPVNNTGDLIDEFKGITDLDLYHVPLLTSLNCSNNFIAKLDLTHVPNLYFLSCRGCGLTELNLSSLKELIYLDCGNSRPFLSGIDYSNTQFYSGVNSKGNKLLTLDLSQHIKLRELNCEQNLLQELDITMLTELTSVDVSSNFLIKLSIHNAEKLRLLSCNNNHLNEFNLKCLPALKSLYCHHNHLSTIDLSDLPNLEVLYVSNNLIKLLDIRNTKLQLRYKVDFENLVDVDECYFWCDDKVKVIGWPKK